MSTLSTRLGAVFLRSACLPGILFASVTLLVGCGGAEGEVTGRVLLNGQPVHEGFVTFISATRRTVSSSVGPDGTYTVSGVPVGLALIGVASPTQRRPATRSEIESAEKMSIVASKLPPDAVAKMPRHMKSAISGTPTLPIIDAIPPQFAVPDSSGLSYEVKRGKQTYDIELK